jgi:hypothetical protein
VHFYSFYELDKSDTLPLPFSLWFSVWGGQSRAEREKALLNVGAVGLLLNAAFAGQFNRRLNCKSLSTCKIKLTDAMNILAKKLENMLMVPYGILCSRSQPNSEFTNQTLFVFYVKHTSHHCLD